MTIDPAIVNNASQTGRRVTPNKNQNNFTCLLLYQFAAILSQKYQAFPAAVAFNQGLPIFYFLF
jgi:hypothetical protein